MQDKTKIFNKALQLQMKGKFSEAQNLYLKLINENFYSDKLFYFTGTSFLQTNNYNKAIKFLDRSLFISNNFSKQQKKEFTNSALIKLVLILPQNIITIFNKEFNKKKYYISTGSLIDRIDNGYDKGGLFNSGHILAELYIILNSYFFLILLIFLLYLIIFTLFNSLQIKKDNKIIFSPIIIVFLLTLIFTGGADSIMGLISTIVRSFLQTLILYFFIICFYLKFFKQT